MCAVEPERPSIMNQTGISGNSPRQVSDCDRRSGDKHAPESPQEPEAKICASPCVATNLQCKSEVEVCPGRQPSRRARGPQWGLCFSVRLDALC